MGGMGEAGVSNLGAGGGGRPALGGSNQRVSNQRGRLLPAGLAAGRPAGLLLPCCSAQGHTHLATVPTCGSHPHLWVSNPTSGFPPPRTRFLDDRPVDPFTRDPQPAVSAIGLLRQLHPQLRVQVLRQGGGD